MKYVIRFMLFLFLNICFHTSLSAQGISKINYNHKYEFLYQEQQYKYLDMGDILSQHEGAYVHYVKATKKLKTAKIWGIVSLSSLGFSAILFASDIGIDKGDVAYKSVFGVWLIAIVTLPSGIISLITGGLGRKDKRSSIALFNEAYGVQLTRENPIELSLVVKNGLGLQLKF